MYALFLIITLIPTHSVPTPILQTQVIQGFRSEKDCEKAFTLLEEKTPGYSFQHACVEVK